MWYYRNKRILRFKLDIFCYYVRFTHNVSCITILFSRFYRCVPEFKLTIVTTYINFIYLHNNILKIFK